MKGWMHAHFEALRVAVRRLTAHPAGMLLSTAVIVAALFLPLAGYLAVANLAAIGARIGSQARITVFLSPSAGERERRSVEQAIATDPAVHRFEFVGREQALADLSRRLGGADVLSGLDSNPLPDAFVVSPAETGLAGSDALAVRLRRLPGVETVEDDPAWAGRWRTLARLGNSAVLAGGLLAVLAMVAICFNTIRLQVLTQREEILVSKLIGATDSFIHRPFYYTGALLGLCAGGVALGAVALAPAPAEYGNC